MQKLYLGFKAKLYSFIFVLIFSIYWCVKS